MGYCYQCMEKLVDGLCPDCGHVDLEQNPHHLSPGTVLKEKYLIGACIGAGGFGITYIGRDLVLDIRIAVKEYFPNQFSVRNSAVSSEVTITTGKAAISDVTVTAGKSTYEKSMERFLSEARTLARFDKDAGIVKVKDFFEANNTAYIIMEYVDGLTLKEHLALKGRFDADEITEKMRPVMEALSRVHEKGLVHRDISPDNIKLQADGSLKLLDFGAARFVSADLDKTVTSMTKAGYAPEEQYRSGGEQGAWTDVYALCATIYKCVTSETPPDAPQRVHNKTRGKEDLQKPSELDAVISPYLETVILRGMAVLQEDRYQSMDELLAALDKKPDEDISVCVLSGGNEPASEAPEPEPPENPRPKKKEKDKPVRKPIDLHALKKALRITGIAAASVAAVLALIFFAQMLISSANQITIAGNKYDKSETIVSIADKTLTPDDISQLSKLTSLRVLTLKNCGLDSDITAVISRLADIRSINLSSNPGITDCSALANRPELAYLYLNGTGVQDISFLSELTGLIELELNDCQISDITPIAKCEALSHLSISGNNISDLSPMERLLKLKYVDISRNKISSLAGMANCAVLETINFSDNEITDIDFLAKSAGTLKNADISRNPLNNATFAYAFDNCPLLETLIADDIGIIGTWDVADLPNIVTLSMADNDIESLVFPSGRGTSLANLNLSGNSSLNRVSASDATAWKIVDLSNTALINQSLTLSASTIPYAELILANCTAIDLQDVPSDMSYSLLDIRSDIVLNAALISQISGNELLINYSDDKDCFDTDAIAASKIYKIRVYNAPLDMQEKISRELSGKSVYFSDGISNAQASSERVYLHYDESYTIYEYGSNGIIIGEAYYDSDDSIMYRMVYDELDTNGNCIKGVVYDLDGLTMGWMAYEYDAAGNRTKGVAYDPDDSIVGWVVYDKYDANRTHSIESYYNSDGSIDFIQEYNTEGRIVKYTSYDSDGSIVYIDEYEYDINGKRNKEITYDSDGSISEWIKYEYSTNGNCTVKTLYDADDSILWRWEGEYGTSDILIKDTYYNADGSVDVCREYDANGHCTKETRFSSDGTAYSTMEYEYDNSGNLIKDNHYNADGICFRRTDYWYGSAYGAADGELAYYVVNELDEDGNSVVSYFYTPDGELFDTQQAGEQVIPTPTPTPTPTPALRNGYEANVSIDGGIYTGNFVDGLQSGYGVFIYSSGAKYEGEWKNGLPNGKGTVVWDDGTKFEGEFIDGERTSGVETYFGSVFYLNEIEYDSQKRRVRTTSYNEDGSMARTENVVYNTDGSYIATGYYGEGNLEFIIEVDENGNRTKETHYNRDGSVRE